MLLLEDLLLDFVDVTHLPKHLHHALDLGVPVGSPVAVGNSKNSPPGSLEHRLPFDVLNSEVAVLVAVVDLPVALHRQALTVEVADQVDGEAAGGVLVSHLQATSPQCLGNFTLELGVDLARTTRDALSSLPLDACTVFEPFRDGSFACVGHREGFDERIGQPLAGCRCPTTASTR